MKASIYLSAILLVALLFVTTACNKDKTPDEDKDWNVLEWTVDGERYKAECEGDPLFGCDPVDCQYYNDTKTLELIGRDNNSATLVIRIYRHLKVNDSTRILSDNDLVSFYNKNIVESECRAFRIDTNMAYNIFVTSLDTNRKLLEGEFYFSGVSDCQDTAEVSDGYFKLTYRP